MSDLVERLQNWRNKDQADAIVLTRGDIITLLTEIERLGGILQFHETASKHETEGLRVEIERLRAANIAIGQMNEQLVKSLADAAATKPAIEAAAGQDRDQRGNRKPPPIPAKCSS